MRIAIGVDHRGFMLKEYLKKKLELKIPITWLDIGAFSNERTDYPLFVKPVCDLVLCQKAEVGILSCGSGIGMAIAANRYPGIYAALVWNSEVAQLAKSDDNANILVLPADFLTGGQAITLVQVWLETMFKGGRYAERVALIDSL